MDTEFLVSIRATKLLLPIHPYDTIATEMSRVPDPGSHDSQSSELLRENECLSNFVKFFFEISEWADYKIKAEGNQP